MIDHKDIFIYLFLPRPEQTTQDHPFHLTTRARTATESADPISASLATSGPTGLSMVDNHTRFRGIADDADADADDDADDDSYIFSFIEASLCIRG